MSRSVTANISGLTITDGSSSGDGGAINNDGTLNLTDCTVSNSTSANDGGGIENGFESTMTILSCTVSGNSSADGGGIDNEGTMTIVNSTIANNTAEYNGGGIQAGISGTLTLINSTVADNYSAESGGGMDVPGSCTIGNTIIADNTATAYPDLDGYVTTDSGNNLIGDTSGASNLSGSGDLTNVDPVLGALGNYGGPTETCPLLPGSPAINAGSNALLPAGVTTDQRGFYRFANGTTDIGAFQVQDYVVTSTADSGGGSLRSAITDAAAAGESDIYLTTSGMITLLSALPEISQDVNIIGPGANALTVSGNDANQVFMVPSGVTAEISGLAIDHGYESSEGGAIDNDGTLTLTDCTVSNSSSASSGFGGGIANDPAGLLTLLDCTVSGNFAGYGGGIGNDGTLTIVNSTIADNTATSDGGGIYIDEGAVSLVNCTVAEIRPDPAAASSTLAL